MAWSSVAVAFLLTWVGMCESHDQTPGSVGNRLYTDVVTESEYEIFLQPPEDGTRATHDVLHAIHQMEQSKENAQQRQAAAEDVELLRAEKDMLRRIIRKSF